MMSYLPVPSQRARLRFGAAVALAVATFAAGCGSDDDSGGSEKADASSAPVVLEAKKKVAEYASTDRPWTGPKTGPKIVPGKSIVYIACASNNQVCVQIGQRVQEAGRKAGWDVKAISAGQGTQQEQTSAWNQAIALKPDGIVNGATDATANKQSLLKAKQRDIAVVGTLSTAKPGDASDVNEFANVSQDPAAVGRAEIDYIVASSKGEARVVVQGIPGYAIAAIKSDAMVDQLAKCETCKMLDDVDTDLTTFQKDTAQLVAGWVSKYGPGFWVSSVADALLNPMPGALRAGRVDPEDVKLVAADGAPESYDRIRKGDYQVATFPQSPGQIAYQAVDEMNRAFAGEEPTGFAQPIYLVDESNVDAEGGSDNQYEPTNGYQDQYTKIWHGE